LLKASTSTLGHRSLSSFENAIITQPGNRNSHNYDYNILKVCVRLLPVAMEVTGVLW